MDARLQSQGHSAAVPWFFKTFIGYPQLFLGFFTGTKIRMAAVNWNTHSTNHPPSGDRKRKTMNKPASAKTNLLLDMTIFSAFL